jgi:hypothetical protein
MGVFFADGKCIKQPDDATGQYLETPASRSFHDLDARTNDKNFIRDFLVATGWKDGNDLVIQVIGEYNLNPGKNYAHFQYDATYRVIGSTFGFVTNEPRN